MEDSSSVYHCNSLETEKTQPRQTERKQTESLRKKRMLRRSDIINDDSEGEIEHKLPVICFKSTTKQSVFSERELLNNVQALENTLKSFGLQAKVIQVNCPTITRFATSRHRV